MCGVICNALYQAISVTHSLLYTHVQTTDNEANDILLSNPKNVLSFKKETLICLKFTLITHLFIVNLQNFTQSLTLTFFISASRYNFIFLHWQFNSLSLSVKIQGHSHNLTFQMTLWPFMISDGRLWWNKCFW